MKILILELDRYSTQSKDVPEVGKYYILEDADDATESQNRLFHALLTEYHKSGVHPFVGGEDWVTLRNWVKKNLGEKFDSFAYVTIDEDLHTIKVVDKYKEIPQAIRSLPDKHLYIRGRLKSWADYTKKQRMACIDKLILDMLANGVNTKKFENILEDIGYDQN